MRASVRLGALCFAAALLLALPQGAAASAKLLSVSKAGSGTGNVTSSPEGIGCGTSCTASFAEGQTVTLSASSGPNTQPVQWSGCDSIAAGNCLVTINGPRSVTATFSLEQRTLSVAKHGSGSGTVSSSPGGINCGSSCTASFDIGQSVTLTGSSGPNTAPVQWTGCDSINAEGKCVVSMGAARSVGAAFELIGPQLSVTKAGTGTGTVTSSPAGIECGSFCAATFLTGTTVTLTGFPSPHSLAVQWSGCAPVSGHPEKCEVTIDAAKGVTATFNIAPAFVEYPLKVERTGNGAGTVTSSPAGISCGAICTASFLTGTSVGLTASASPGSVFSGWSGGGCTGAGLCATVLNRERAIKAKFTLAGQRTLSVAKAGTGQGTVTAKAAGIECGTRCSAQVAAGKKVTLAAKAAAGSTFNHWSGACSGAKGCVVTMSEARSVTATFASSAPPAPACTVPKLKGKSLAGARTALGAAHCSLGKVRKPKGAKGALVVKSSSPGAGVSLATGAKVGVRMKVAPREHKAHRRRP